MNADIAAKLLAISTCEGPTPEPRVAFARLADDLERYLLNLTGQPERDLDHIEYEPDGNMGFFVGWGEGIRRLMLSVELRAGGDAYLALRATKGNIDIGEIEWGDTGPEVGNSILVMRLLHVGICSFRQLGFRRLTNDPWNERLRGLYMSFGFTNGETLDLYDSNSLTTALTAIDRAYSRFGVDFGGPPP